MNTTSKFQPGDLIAWDVRSGAVLAQVEWVDKFGPCGLRMRDGYSEFFERMPDRARPMTTAEVEKWNATKQAARPIAYE